jgi:hypothetical protein
MPMEIRDAVGVAAKYISEILSVPPARLLLEEVELSEDERYWYITFSYPTPRDPDDLAVYVTTPRSFKTVKMNASNGRLEAIRIREQ